MTNLLIKCLGIALACFISFHLNVASLFAGAPVQLIGSEVSSGDAYGDDLAMDSEWLFVGAPFDDAIATDAGAVYVFRKVNGDWIEWQILRSDQGANAESDNFGRGVAVDGDRAAVGAPWDIDVPLSDTSGRVYFYRLIEDMWTLEATRSDPSATGYEFYRSNFGHEIAIEGDRILIGAPIGDDVYEYRFPDETAVPELVGGAFLAGGTEIKEPMARYGESISLDGDTVIIGGWNAFTQNFMDNGRGRIAILERGVDDWNAVEFDQGQTLCDHLGKRVALRGDVAVAWAYGVGNTSCDLKEFDSDPEGPIVPPATQTYIRTDGQWNDGDPLDVLGATFVIEKPDPRQIFGSFSYVNDNPSQRVIKFHEFVEGVPLSLGSMAISVVPGVGAVELDESMVFSDDEVIVARSDSDRVEVYSISGFPLPDLSLVDLNGDLAVNGQDLAILLARWGADDATADINGDGIVNGADLAQLLASWTG